MIILPGKANDFLLLPAYGTVVHGKDMPGDHLADARCQKNLGAHKILRFCYPPKRNPGRIALVRLFVTDYGLGERRLEDARMGFPISHPTSADLAKLDLEAGHLVAYTDLTERRNCLTARLYCYGTTWMETTAGGRVQRTGYLPL